MRKSRFADEPMVAILREADRDQIATVAKRHGISEMLQQPRLQPVANIKPARHGL